MLYNATKMIRLLKISALVSLALALTSCAAAPKKLLLDPFPVRLPLVEAARVPIDGHVVGQPRAHDGVVYYATREGRLAAVVIPSQTVLWQFATDGPISYGPEAAGGLVLVRDDGGVLYGVAGPPSRAALKIKLDAAVPSTVRIVENELVLTAAEGDVRRFDFEGRETGGYRLPAPGARVTAGPVPVYGRDRGLVSSLFGYSDGRLIAVDLQGALIWEYRAAGAITADPVVSGGRVYFGTDARMFYCLGAKKGHKKWSRRLQGAPVHPALVSGGRIVVAASNSVVYVLARSGGSIVAWEPIASRLLHEPCAAGPFVLVSSAAPGLKALDARTGAKVEELPTAGPLVAGALSSPPFIVLVEEDPDSGAQALVFLRSKPVPAPAAVEKPARMP